MSTKDELERAVIDAARSWCHDGVRNAYPLEQAVDNLEEFERESEQRDKYIWVMRTWRDVRPGDLVRPPGNPNASANVLTAIRLSWHVDPRSGVYQPTPLEHSVVRATLTPGSGGKPRDFDPVAPVEIFLSREELAAIEMLGWENRVLVTG